MGKTKFLEKIFEKNFLMFFLENKNFGKKIFKIFFQLQVLYLAHILSKFQVVQNTTSLCHNVVSHNKSKKKTKSQKRGLATTVEPEPDFSRACSFRKMLGINEDCLEEKFHRNC